MRRKPSALLELNGAYRKNPARRRQEPPSAGPLGPPPERMSPEARAYWIELESMAPPGVLQRSDRWAVEVISRLVEKANRVVDPAVILELAKSAELTPQETKALVRQQSMSSAEWSVLNSLMGRIGLSPADRSRLNVATERPTNKFSALAEAAKNLGGKPN